jgi:hypothetical protein
VQEFHVRRIYFVKATYNHQAVKWALALCLVLVLGLSLTVAANNAATNELTPIPTKSEAEKVINIFIDAVKRGDVDSMMKCCVDSRGSIQDQRELYKSLIAEGEPYPTSVQFNTIDIMTHKNVGSLGVTNATVTYSNGQTKNQPLKFIKDQGEWKIYVTSD